MTCNSDDRDEKDDLDMEHPFVQVRFYRLQEFKTDKNQQEVPEETDELAAGKPVYRYLKQPREDYPSRFDEGEEQQHNQE